MTTYAEYLGDALREARAFVRRSYDARARADQALYYATKEGLDLVAPETTLGLARAVERAEGRLRRAKRALRLARAERDAARAAGPRAAGDLAALAAALRDAREASRAAREARAEADRAARTARGAAGAPLDDAQRLAAESAAAWARVGEAAAALRAARGVWEAAGGSGRRWQPLAEAHDAARALARAEREALAGLRATPDAASRRRLVRAAKVARTRLRRAERATRRRGQ